MIIKLAKEDKVFETIDGDSIVSLKRRYEAFGSTFELGSTPIQTFTLEISKETVNYNPSFCLLLNDDETVFSTLNVGEIESEDDMITKYTLYDNMKLFDFYYDVQPVLTETTTLADLVDDICSNANVELASGRYNGLGYDQIVASFDNSMTARQHIGFIAERNGGYAYINSEGKLEFRRYTNTPSAVINVEDCSSFKADVGHVVTSVRIDTGDMLYKYPEEDVEGMKLFLDTSNPYLVSGTDDTINARMQEIYSVVGGFTYYNIDVENMEIPNIDPNSTLAFEFNGTQYNTLFQIDTMFSNGYWIGGFKLDVSEAENNITVVNGTANKIRAIRTKVDHLEAVFTREVIDTSNPESIASKVEQSSQYLQFTLDQTTGVKVNFIFDKNGLSIKQIINGTNSNSYIRVGSDGGLYIVGDGVARGLANSEGFAMEKAIIGGMPNDDTPDYVLEAHDYHLSCYRK